MYVEFVHNRSSAPPVSIGQLLEVTVTYTQQLYPQSVDVRDTTQHTLEINPNLFQFYGSFNQGYDPVGVSYYSWSICNLLKRNCKHVPTCHLLDN